jgi:hypothetical protein
VAFYDKFGQDQSDTGWSFLKMLRTDSRNKLKALINRIAQVDKVSVLQKNLPGIAASNDRILGIKELGRNAPVKSNGLMPRLVSGS